MTVPALAQQQPRTWLICQGTKPTGEPCRTPLGELVNGVLIRKRKGATYLAVGVTCRCGWQWGKED